MNSFDHATYGMVGLASNLSLIIQQYKSMKRDVILTEDVWRLIHIRYGREALLCRELNWCVEQALSSYEPTGVHDAVEAACWVFYCEYDCDLRTWLDDVYESYKGPWTCWDHKEEMDERIDREAEAHDPDNSPHNYAMF